MLAGIHFAVAIPLILMLEARDAQLLRDDPEHNSDNATPT